MSRTHLSFETPEGVDPMGLVAIIAAEADGDDSGYVQYAGQTLSWDMDQPGSGIELDRRQRLAAAMLLMGFDLPQEAMAASRSMIAAARVCPGMTTGDIGGMGTHGRRAMLTDARRLIDEMLSEMDACPKPSPHPITRGH